MNRVWSIEYGVSGLVPLQVAGGSPGWQVAGMLRSRGDRRPGGCCGGCCGGFIIGSRVSAVGYQVQVFRFGYRSRACFPHPCPQLHVHL